MKIYCRWFPSIFRGATLITCVALSSTLLAANNQYCGTKQSHAILSAEKLKNAALDDGTEVAFFRWNFASGLIVNREQDHEVTVNFNFQYAIISFDDTITPMTNGHLHSWDFPVTVHRKGAGYSFDYYLAPAIAVSSNGLKSPDLLDSDALQLWAGAIYKKELNQESTWLLGFRSDHRFGPYRAYPVAGFCWQPNANWQLQLVLPDFSIRRFFSNGINIKFFAEPDGNKWHVFSKDTTNNSDFITNAIVAGLSIEWQINSTVTFGISAVQHSKREFSLALDDGTRVDTNAQSSTGVSVSLGLLF